MPASVVRSEINPSQAHEKITVMDDYGTEAQLYVPVSDSANRQHHIDAMLAQQTANEAALEAYAKAHGIDLSAQKTAGLIKKEGAR